MAVITHKYEFPAENMVAPFGAGWTLSHSPTRSLYFPAGSNLDDIITTLGNLRDEGSTETLTKETAVRAITYTRLNKKDSVTVRYPSISFRLVVLLPLGITGTVTPAEQLAFEIAAPGSAMPGWVISNAVNHTIVTHTTGVDRVTVPPGFTPANPKNAVCNPRFLAGFEAIDYVQSPVASFSVTVTSTGRYNTVQFTDATKFKPTAWLWEFPGGLTSTEQYPIRILDLGIHHVRLTATNSAGSSTVTRAIVVRTEEERVALNDYQRTNSDKFEY